MSAVVLAEKIFTLEDQHEFARFSGDSNPIHIDPLTARRSLAGEPVVHGIHLLLWSLEAVCSHVGDLPPIAALRVNFEKMVTIGKRAEAVLVERKNERMRIEVRVDGRAAVVILASLNASAARGEPFRRVPIFDSRQPVENSIDDLTGMAGKVLPFKPASDAAHLFPTLARNIGLPRLCGLAAATFVVGMVCPGLFSIFRSLDLSAADAENSEGALNFEVSSIDSRFQLARLGVSGLGWVGKLDAHLRPKQVMQPSLADVSKHVRENEFAGVNALIIGGSRGLGEVLAKILAAGGATVAITYRTGEEDALGVQNEILAAGGRCEVLKYDVTVDSPDILSSLSARPSQLYFMASPQIKPNTSGGFNATQFDAYADCYLHAFSRVTLLLAKLAEAELSVFYPSTIFVAEPKEGFLEYAAAKAAGESLCQGIALQGLVKKAVVNRLPRLLTDQTRGLAEESFPDSIALLVSIARSLG